MLQTIDYTVLDISNSCSTTSTLQHGNLLVIDTVTKEILKRISIGTNPNNVAVDSATHKIFITNQLSDSLTIIDPVTYEPTTISQIGVSPFGVTANSKDGKIYITSSASNSVILFNTKEKNIQHPVTFKTEPPKSGFIKCNDINFLLNKLYYITDETKCSAESISGFNFHSWVYENGESVSYLNNHPYSNFIDIGIKSFLNLLGYDTGQNTLIIKKPGVYTVNFIEQHTLIPKEQLTGLYLLATGIFTTWLIPNLSRWIYSGRKSRIQNKTFSNYLQMIELSKKKSMDEVDFGYLRIELIDKLSNGKLTENQFSILDKKLSEINTDRK